MPGKRVQLDDETLEALVAVARRSGRDFQELADEAFSDLLKKHKQTVGLMASLKKVSALEQRKSPDRECEQTGAESSPEILKKCELPWSLPPPVGSGQPPRMSEFIPPQRMIRCSVGGTSDKKKPR
jgi:hypothetical protein